MQLDHITIFVAEMERSGRFYEQVLGLEPIPEPFHDGVHLWYRIGPGLSLHVVGIAGSLPERPIQMHIAFRVASLEPVMARLDANSVAFRNLAGDGRVTFRPDGLRQIYLQDPDGYWIEINEAGA